MLSPRTLRASFSHSLATRVVRHFLGTPAGWRSPVSGLARLVGGLAVIVLLLIASAAPGQAQSSVRPPAGAVTLAPPGPEMQGDVLGNRSRAEVWHDIRKGVPGRVNIPDPNAPTLIQSQGEDWRLFHNDVVKVWGGRIFAGVVVAIFAFFLIRGRIRIKGGRSGRVMPRFSLVERVVHWFTAVLFVLLAVSGIILFLGKDVLMPVVGPTVFAMLASASLQGHNLFGPLFVVAIVALFITFVRGNGFRWVDVVWALKGGGLLGGHASSHRYNFGEKSWFWLASFGGVALSVSGILMLFPDHLPGMILQATPEAPPARAMMQLANLVHGIAAVAFIAVAFGHIYIGTLGMEGALEGMTRGTVDENWAKEHHDLWYEAHLAESSTDSVGAEVAAAAGKV
jgi:formate dehydrogenase subunit gamma